MIRRALKTLPAWIVTLAFASTVLAADVPPAVAPTAPQQAAETKASAPGNVTVDFKDADIQNVLRILSFKSGVNIVAGKDVTGSVTIRLVDVPWEKALDVVLKTYGYAYDRDGNIIRVTTLENLKKEELSTEVYPLNYSRASEVEKALGNVLSERGKLRSDARTNTLIVTDMPTVLNSVAAVVERLDRPTRQVLIETKVVEATLGTGDRLGIKWNLKAGINGSARPTTFPFDAIQRGPLYRILPDGRAPETSTDSVGTSGTTSTSTTTDFPTRANQPSFPVVDKDEFQFGTLDFSQFSAMLELLEARDDTKILSEPHVVTLDNQEAKILVGEVIAIPTFERNSTTGRMEITGYRDRDSGIRLTVTPQVNDQQEIVVSIHPEITELLGYDDLTPEIKAPRFSTREARTQVRIRSGQTIAIGGLIKETTTEANTKVPVLGDIPLVKNLFNHNEKSVKKTDLLFFMTVKIVDQSALPQGHDV
ncbi:MAG: Type IV pilus biogenesis and competence protein PilQ [Candidatus Omnitrophica bacterium]|nr:Type IV pilus biogenesis and competence protein PilQ [Candidatus Omnitrophota bacterium]